MNGPVRTCRALLQQGDAAGAIEVLRPQKKLSRIGSHQLPIESGLSSRRPVAEAQLALAAYQKLIEANRLKKRESLEADKP